LAHKSIDEIFGGFFYPAIDKLAILNLPVTIDLMLLVL
jgi:hypothetical protein